MSHAEILRQQLLTVQVDERFTEAILQFSDCSRLVFCHRVGERWARAVGQEENETGLAGILLSAMTLFRLNAKHLDIQFDDDSRWDESLRRS